MLIHFVIPIYNEEQILEKNSLKLLNFLKLQNYNFSWNLILLVNGSSDKSEKIAQKMELQHQEIVATIIGERGKGNALKKFLDQTSADFSFYMDVDLAVSLENINDIIRPLLEEIDYDIFIGSRIKKGSITDRKGIRELSSRCYILISKIIIKHRLSDLQCGFKGIKKEAWNKISPLIVDQGWFFDTELLLWGQLLGLKIKETPVNWSENRYERRKSKVKLFKDSIVFVKKLLQLRKKIKDTDISKHLSS